MALHEACVIHSKISHHSMSTQPIRQPARLKRWPPLHPSFNANPSRQSSRRLYHTLSEKVFSPKQHCSTHGLQCFWQSRKCLVDCGGFSRWNRPLFYLYALWHFELCHSATFPQIYCQQKVQYLIGRTKVKSYIYLGNREQIQPRTDWMIME